LAALLVAESIPARADPYLSGQIGVRDGGWRRRKDGCWFENRVIETVVNDAAEAGVWAQIIGCMNRNMRIQPAHFIVEDPNISQCGLSVG